MNNTKIELDNYSIHKQLYAQLEPNADKITTELSNIGAWFSVAPECDYYMLMCKEISYFTVFHFNNMNYMAGMQELEATLKGRGTIVDIVYVHSEDAYECWVRDDNGEVFMYYLFPYDWGIVEVE